MASALPKRADNEEIVVYMEYLSKNYFSQIFPNSTISIEPKPKAGKQGGHVVIIQPNEASSTNTTIEKFYVKPQDNYVIPSISSLSSKLANVEELFVYKFLFNFNTGPSVHFYVNQEKPECLLIATADGNNIINENFHTVAYYPRAELDLITIENLVLIRIIEIIFCLKDLLSNKDNYGWLSQSKRLFIIDFSIDNNEIMKTNPTPASKMINSPLPILNRLSLDKLAQNYNKFIRNEKESTVRKVIEPLSDSFLEAINTSTQSIDDFIVSFPFAFNHRTKEITRSRLQQFAQLTRARFNELRTYLNINKE